MFSFNAYSQNEIVNNIVEEAENNSQLESLAHELLDLIGPRLVGTPQMKNAHDWAIEKYKSWGIDASLHQFGEWNGWERGITHIDMIQPRLRTLTGRQLAYNPSTSKKGITAKVDAIPEVARFLQGFDLTQGSFEYFVIKVNLQFFSHCDHTKTKFNTHFLCKPVLLSKKH